MIYLFLGQQLKIHHSHNQSQCHMFSVIRVPNRSSIRFCICRPLRVAYRDDVIFLCLRHLRFLG